MDIKPPPKQRPPVPNRPDSAQPVNEKPAGIDVLDISKVSSDFSIRPGKGSDNTRVPKRKLSAAKRISLAVAALIVLLTVGAMGWYKWAMGPVSATETWQTFVVESGETPSTIAKHLEQARLIRSALAFEVYAKAHGSADSLQAGTYKFSPSQPVASIIGELVKGQNATYNILIPPGLTLKQLADPAIKGSFAAQGFSAQEIQQALSATYASPLLRDKPADASLEGYIFPETFQIRHGDTLQSVIQRSLDELYARLSEGGLIEKFASRGLTVHQALTLASIIQKEVTDANDQRQVAQVFLKRLSEGMLLGSDVTFIYAANQAGVTPSVDIDSPYNTRKYAGLPPGPIANMHLSALEAIANPASGDYLYFVAGDGEDKGKTFFSRTYEEHQAAIAAHCHTLCSAAVE